MDRQNYMTQIRIDTTKNKSIVIIVALIKMVIFTILEGKENPGRDDHGLDRQSAKLMIMMIIMMIIVMTMMILIITERQSWER